MSNEQFKQERTGGTHYSLKGSENAGEIARLLRGELDELRKNGASQEEIQKAVSDGIDRLGAEYGWIEFGENPVWRVPRVPRRTEASKEEQAVVKARKHPKSFYISIVLSVFCIGLAILCASLIIKGYTAAPDDSALTLEVSNNSVATSGKPPETGSALGVYVGSIESDKYHLPSCRWAQNISPENEIWFDSISEAQDAGYSPCGTCMK